MKYILFTLIALALSVPAYAITYYQVINVEDPTWVIDNHKDYPTRIFKIADNENDCYVAVARLNTSISCLPNNK